MRISGTYVDDSLRCSTPDFEELSKLTHENFEITGSEELPLIFVGFNIKLRLDDAYNIDQLFYSQKLETLQATAT